MKAYQFIAPLNDNDGNSLTTQHEALQTALLHRYGGYTTEDVTGAWINDNGRIYAERNARYTVAVDECECDNLQEIARAHVLDNMRQECVYFQHPDGGVEFLS